MKDKRLEQQFDEYFQGVNTPGNITNDAKKYVVKKQSVLPKFVKFASVAASFLLVFVSATVIILNSNKTNDKAQAPESPGAIPPSSAGYSLYGDGELSFAESDAYAVSELDSSLKFIQTLAYAQNADVHKCEAYDLNGNLALVKADMSLISGLNRHDTKFYVEFTEQKVIYDELQEFFVEKVSNYKSAEYRIASGFAENGEPQFKLYINYDGVKYYFDVTSTDESAYMKYLNMIVK